MTQNQPEEKNGNGKGNTNQKQDRRKHHDRNFEQKKDMKHNPKHDGRPAVKPETKEVRTDTKKEQKQEQRPMQKQEHKKQNHNEHKPEGRVYKYIAFVSFKDSKKIYTFGTDVDEYRVGDDVVVETIRGLELGKIVKDNQQILTFQNLISYLKKTEAFLSNGMEIKPIIRKASTRDLKQVQENAEKAKKAMDICAECIRKLNLDMNLIEAEYTLDCSKIIFVYVADERVDFRELLKELASIFKCRIELRQIGPRNKSKIIGGLGTCGMETCCSRFMNDFDVVSINMAKNQLLALNIQKLSGQCGKLMCCLKFEDSQYKRLREGLPKMNSQIEYKGSRYRITSMNVLLQQVKIENKEDVQFLSFKELWPDIDFSDR